MKVSELISKLEALKEKHGDLDIINCNYQYRCFGDPTIVLSKDLINDYNYFLIK